MKYQIIVADPPYQFSDKLKMNDTKRGAESNYNTLSVDQLSKLPIPDLADPNGSLLALWVPSSILEDGLYIMKSWKFDLKQTWIWVKLKNDPFKKLRKDKNINWDQINFDDFLSFGMGRLGRNVHELVLIGTRGSVYKNLCNKSQRTVFFYKNVRHSEKPSLLQDKLDLMFPLSNRLEIFGRKLRNNWTVIGNESPYSYREDITISIDKLLNI